MESESALVTLDEIRAAWEVIKEKVHRTPLVHSTYLSEQTGANVYLKLELFQKTGSFKVRGVTNKMNSLTPEEKQNGVVTLSAGNHAQAVAWGATQFGIPSTVVMPKKSVVSKQIATRGYGGKVVLSDTILDTVMKIKEEENLYLIHPFDDPKIIAGHGTLGMEIIEDVPNVDIVLTGIGGGGLISGTAAAVKQLKPDTAVYGVEPEGATGMSNSLAQGSPATLDAVNTVADGLAAPFVGEHNLRHVQAFVDEVVIVDDEEILQALRLVWERCKVTAEPAACASVAALLTGKIEVPAGANIVCVLSGGNVDLNAITQLLP